jgi:TonB-linked SusC/RagA family outer membrane protein
MGLLNEAINRTGQQTSKRYSEEDIQAYRNGASDPLRYPNYDWVDAMFDNALMHQHYLSVNGGGNKTTYNFGLGMLSQDGVLMATSYDKYDAMLNVNTKMNDHVSFGANVNFMYGNRKQQNGTMENTILCIYTAHPTYGPQLPDGSGRYVSRAYPYESANQNPIAFSRLGGTTIDNYNASGTAYLKLNIIDGLTGEIRGAGRWSMANNLSQSASIPVYYYQPYADGTHGAAQNFGGNDHSITRKDENSTKYTLYATLTYDKVFAENHHLTVMGGYNQENFKFWTLNGYRYQFINLDMTDLDAGNANGQTTGGLTEEWAIQSLFGRANYVFKDRYLFEASVRYDGSSRLKKGNRWGLFPSVSAGWRISEENFAKSAEWMNNLKLRGSWGKLGNDNIGNYPWQDLLGLTYYSFETYGQGVEKVNMSNQEITWEETTSIDLGLDFSFFKHRLHGTIDWFDRRTSSILRKKLVPAYTGLAGPTVNEGEMKNTGFEILLGHENTVGDVIYGISANLTTYKNEVTKYGSREISGDRIRQEGLPWNSYYLLKNIGIFRSQAEIDDPTTPKHQANPQPGDLRYQDVSGPAGIPDNEIDPTYDRVVVDGAFPKFNYGVNLYASYKGFDLSVFMQGVRGRKVYVREWGIAPFRQYGPPPVMWRDRWTPDNPDASLPGLWVENSYTPNTQASTFWLQDASYLRLKNLQIGYSFPSHRIRKLKLKQLRIYFSGDNLFTITDFYNGGDPERIDEGRFAIYPQTAIYSFGIKLTY